MRRITLLLAAVALLAVSLAPVVQAQDGKGTGPVDAGGAPENFGSEQLINPGDYPGTCSFPVLLEASGKIKTIELPNGTTLFTFPGLDATLTNPETGTSETYSVTGANRVLPPDEEDIVVTEVTGRNLLIDPEAGFVVASGNFSFAFDTQGTPEPEDDVLVQPLEGEGQLIDVCEALA
jgi:hypothetical protein